MPTTIHAAPIAFSVGEVAELLGCSTDTVRRMIASSLLDAVQPLGKGGRVFIGRSSIERLFDATAVGTLDPDSIGGRSDRWSGPR